MSGVCGESCPACSKSCIENHASIRAGMSIENPTKTTYLVTPTHRHQERYGSRSRSGHVYEVTIEHSWIELPDLDDQPRRLA